MKGSFKDAFGDKVTVESEGYPGGERGIYLTVSDGDAQTVASLHPDTVKELRKLLKRALTEDM